VTLLSSYLAQPRVGHLEQVWHIFSSYLVFDPKYVNWDQADFQRYDWTDFYHDAKEPIPPNAPEPRGYEVQINAFVDAHHAGNK